MLQHDPAGKNGPKRPLPKNVVVPEPKEEVLPFFPTSDIKALKSEIPPAVSVAVA